MKIKDFKKNIATKLRKKGFRAYLKETLYYLVSWIFSYRRYFLLSWSNSKPIFETEIKTDIKIKKADRDDIYDLKEIVGVKRLKYFLRLFEEGKNCFIALDNDKIVYYSWISFEQKNFVRMQDKEAYMFSAFTLSEYRGRGIATRMIAERLKLIKQKGYEKALAFASPQNFAAVKALKNNGFEEAGEAFEILVPLLRLHYTRVIRREGGRIIECYKKCGCDREKINLFF